MRSTKIVCTLGPSSKRYETIHKMIESGMDVARINFSHGTLGEHRVAIAHVRKASKALSKVVGLLGDIPGPKLRITDLSSSPLTLEEDQLIQLVESDSLKKIAAPVGVDGSVAISPLGVLPQLDVGSKVSFADGAVEVIVRERIQGGSVLAHVKIPGVLNKRKGVNFPESKVVLPALTAEDVDFITFAVEEKFDFIAISFVGEVSDVVKAQDIVSSLEPAYKPKIIAKIERPNALEDIDAIVRAADIIMVARGDLGVEIAPEAVPIEQKRIIHLCNEIGRPVITATQMLESMIKAPLPTRAEATDVANAILDGTDAVMLSAETAAGDFPLEAVSYMDRIARRTESELANVSLTHLNRPVPMAHTVADAVALSANQISNCLPIKAVLALTESGHSARVVSKYRPPIPVVGAAVSAQAAGSLTLSFGVIPIIISPSFDFDSSVLEALTTTKELGFAVDGDLVLLVAGIPFGVSGTTNLIKVQKVGEPVFGENYS